MFSSLTKPYRYLRQLKMAAIYSKIQNGAQNNTKSVFLTCAGMTSPIVMILVSKYIGLSLRKSLMTLESSTQLPSSIKIQNGAQITTKGNAEVKIVTIVSVGCGISLQVSCFWPWKSHKIFWKTNNLQCPRQEFKMTH